MSVKVNPLHKLSCHCGAVEIQLTLPQGIHKPRRCNCSICMRRGTVVASVKLEDLKILKGKEKLSLYQFNTMTAKHYFCSICGIYTHHQRRSDPTEYGYNTACLEGVNSYEIKNVEMGDGVNHPKDRI
ncbi:GFA family protein [Pseudobacteriovorax antillogorgiicola]|uniref:Uncharacterized conserved protein n=1 Tax=Pseudobacteriovorax antillogorgiicola TaxID=1513793 RepID=A0A1Y6BAW0_9BACT|nr:GFA family protein [Pseudobacteriovorax antillogorgiicola]TCS57361.1 hypothetical protein EDD56_103101 [Pseudobacteriovorax antillogorgiicola]SMF02006.1 Uncharacterized conserved protein [Pseudobacteriovorax antillogorgiicola]